MGAVEALLVVDVAPAPARPAHRGLRLGLAAALGVVAVAAVAAAFAVPDHSGDVRVEPPAPLTSAAVTDTLDASCAAARAAAAPADLVVASPTAYELAARRRLHALADVASDLAALPVRPTDAPRVEKVEAAVAAAIADARTAAALAQSGDTAGAASTLDRGPATLATACR